MPRDPFNPAPGSSDGARPRGRGRGSRCRRWACWRRGRGRVGGGRAGRVRWPAGHRSGRSSPSRPRTPARSPMEACRSRASRVSRRAVTIGGGGRGPVVEPDAAGVQGGLLDPGGPVGVAAQHRLVHQLGQLPRRRGLVAAGGHGEVPVHEPDRLGRQAGGLGGDPAGLPRLQPARPGPGPRAAAAGSRARPPRRPAAAPRRRRDRGWRRGSRPRTRRSPASPHPASAALDGRLAQHDPGDPVRRGERRGRAGRG